MRRIAFAVLIAAACGGGEAPATSEPPPAAPPASADGGAPDAIPPADAGPPTFGVLALNLHCLETSGTAYATNAERFRAIAATVRDARVDLILAQEVCERPGESAREALTAEITEATRTTWASASAFAHRAWEGTPGEADEHVAVFARGAIALPRETVHRAAGSIRRVTLGATVEAPLGEGGAPLRVRVFTVHLDHRDASARLAQARDVASVAMVEGDAEALDLDGGAALPVVIGGDFNARPGTAALAAMTSFGFVEVSGSEGSTRIDHVFSHRSAPLEPVERAVIFTGNDAVSDHPGILVRFGAKVPAPARLTRIAANVAATAQLTVRGSAGPLDWESGWPAFSKLGQTSGVVLVASELPAAPFEYKFLRDDVDWQLGDNVAGQGQADNVVTPTFP
jgi:endonuclease/exonuclease/phosphatase family metal-dependent hydrolase